MTIRTRPLTKTQTVERQVTTNDKQRVLDRIFGLWERYAPWYKSSFRGVSYYKAFCDATEKAFIPGSGGKVLDAGCGDGGLWTRLMRTLCPEKIVGLDYAPAMLKAAEKTKSRLQNKYKIYGWLNRRLWTRWLTRFISEWRFYGCEIELVRADLCQGISYPDNTFDTVVCQLVAYYLPFKAWEYTVSREVLRVTKPGGYIVATDATRPFNFRKEIAGFAAFKEVITHPWGMIWSGLVARPVLVQFQDLANKGVLDYLSEEERKATLETAGYKNPEICGRALKDLFIVTRASKPK